MEFKKKGFTLIEVIAVVCIIGMMASLIVPKIQRHIESANETKYYINAKCINESVDIYNVENMTDQITYEMTLNQIKEKLMSQDKKYIDKWPSQLKVKTSNGVYIVEEANLNSYEYKSLCDYIDTKETCKQQNKS